MPISTINNATVIGGAYSTKGNGKKLVRLDNNALISVVKNSSLSFIIRKSTDNGSTWTSIGSLSVTDLVDVSIVAKGVEFYLMYSYNNSTVNVIRYNDSGTLITNYPIDTAQTAIGNISLAINETKTELYAAWSSKNATYPSSFNMRYAKGVIAGDGSVTWGAIEQVTKINHATYADAAINPSISVFKNDIPVIAFEQQGIMLNGTTTVTPFSSIGILKRDNTLTTGNPLVTNTWTFTRAHYQPDSRVQSSPSMMFVPQANNGLANGRLWVTWHGTDATVSVPNIRVSYSDDGGVTWSAIVKATNYTGTMDASFGSITAYQNGDPTILYRKWGGTELGYGIEKVTYSGGAWGTPVFITSRTISGGPSPSTLFDLTMSVTEPLFITDGDSQVAFYGQWTFVATTTVLDATVVNAAYDTGGNGGRKLVRLSNGWLVALLTLSTSNPTTYYLKVSKNNGTTWSDLCSIKTGTSDVMNGGSITSIGNKLHVLVPILSRPTGAARPMNHIVIDAITQTNVDVFTNALPIGASETTFGNSSIIANEAETELHATWASKNATYANSFNIRYAKGMIATDGSVAWGAVEQVTKMTATNADFVNPSIVLNGSVVSIIANTEDSYLNTNTYLGGTGASSIVILQKSTLLTVNTYLDASWTYKNVYNVTTYVQSSPSAIFVPQIYAMKINASYTNGLLVVGWHGKDAVDIALDNIRCMASSDNGVTWFDFAVSGSKITTGAAYPQQNPTLTFNREGHIFVVWQGQGPPANAYQIKKIKFSNGGWGSIQTVTNNGMDGQVGPSSVLSTNLSFTEPLYIFKDISAGRVPFYGSWYVNPSLPLAPSSITTPPSVTAGGTAGISWSAVTNVDVPESMSYQVDFYDEEYEQWTTLIANTTGTSATVTVPGPRHTSTAKFRVRAYDGYDYGPYVESNPIPLQGLSVTSTATNSTVTPNAYTPSASARPARLSNGWIVTVVHDSAATTVRFYVSKDNGVTFTPLCYRSGMTAAVSHSFVTKGTMVYYVGAPNTGTTVGFIAFDVIQVQNIDIPFTSTTLDTVQTAFSGMTITMNDANTELHVAWSSKNATYLNSFNVKYIKGTINQDKTVTWSVAEQISIMNSASYNAINPSIVLDAFDIPTIFAELTGAYWTTASFTANSTARGIIEFKRDKSLIGTGSVHASWSAFSFHYNLLSYAQTSISTFFVPRRINGLEYGRIWTAWKSLSAANTVEDLMVSYSDNNGWTWTTSLVEEVSLSAARVQEPSITVNKRNEVFVVYVAGTAGTPMTLTSHKYNGTSWVKTTIATAANISNASALADLNTSFSVPLLIYKNTTENKVGFYGTWYENPSIPSVPSTITVPPSVTAGQPATISWSAVTNPDAGETISYQVEFYDSAYARWQDLANGITTLTTIVTIPSPRHSTTTQFRVRAYDGHDYGNYKESSSIQIVGIQGSLSVTDSVVVNSSSDTSGNSGRKLVRLDNGWLISAVYSTTPSVGFYIYKSMDSGSNWSYVTKSSVNGCTSGADISLVAKGNVVYLTSADVQLSTKRWNCYVLDMTTTLQDPLPMPTIAVDSGQNNVPSKGTALIINDAKTELHMAWASINASFTSNNIRYSKGTIASDGSVTWSAAEQATRWNASSSYVDIGINPSIFLDSNGIPCITFEQRQYIFSGANHVGATSYAITLIKRDASLATNNTYVTAPWSFRTVVENSAGFVQSNSSTIFIPQSKNGLVNGRIVSAWHGVDAISPSVNNIYFSYSENNGLSWSPAVNVTTGVSTTYHSQFVTLTVNKDGKIFMVYEYGSANATYTFDIALRSLLPNASSWSSQVIVEDTTAVVSTYPNVLLDPTLSFSKPLFIYKDVAKVGFHGTWYVNPTTLLAPASLTVPSFVTSGQTANISWSAIPNPDAGESITYEVDFYNPAYPRWENLISGVTGISTTVAMPTIGYTSIIKFRVRGYDGYEYGAYKESGNVSLLGFTKASATDVVVRTGSLFDTSGNNGRKIVRLSNKWLVSAVKSGTVEYRFYLSTDNGQVWTYLCNIVGAATNVTSLSISSFLTKVYVTLSDDGGQVYDSMFDAVTVTTGSALVKSIRDAQTAIGSVSNIINETGTEIHQTWSSKNASYPASFNIRYVKGSIATDGVVTWGIVEQVTTRNATSYEYLNPSITLENEVPLIAAEGKLSYVSGGTITTNATAMSILVFKRNRDLPARDGTVHVSWSAQNVYSITVGAHLQTSPSVVFVPESANGLANGELLVFWNMRSASNVTYSHVAFSKSLDGGLTWSSMEDMTPASATAQSDPSVTVRYDGEVHVLFSGIAPSGFSEIRQIIRTNNVWSTIVEITNNSTANKTSPSVLMDASLMFTHPLFIYKDGAEKVGFYGTWASNGAYTPPVEPPTISDAAVVNGVYDTSGNGGRKLVRLNDGTLFSVVKNGVTEVRLYKSIDSGTTWSQFSTTISFTALVDMSLTTNGEYLYLLITFNNGVNSTAVMYGYKKDGSAIMAGSGLDTQTAMGTCSMICSAIDNELHATWSSKNATYPSSFNIRYAKGSIQKDGAVVWSATEQVTSYNSASYINFAINASVVMSNGIPMIVFQQDTAYFNTTTISTTANQGTIVAIKRDASLTTANSFLKANWSYKVIHSIAYAQVSPVASFVPQEINGLEKGRIWTTWSGLSALNTARHNIYVSYSDDNGLTWSVPYRPSVEDVLQRTVSLAVNKVGDVFFVWSNNYSATDNRINTVKYSNNTWGVVTELSGNKLNPSALFDVTLTFTKPLFIYQDAAKVGFYATWTNTIEVIPPVEPPVFVPINKLVTVENTTVVNLEYDAGGNGGRKLVRLDNGWLVAGVRDGRDYNCPNFYVSKDNGLTFDYLTRMDTVHTTVSTTDFAMVVKGTTVYVLYSVHPQIRYAIIDPTAFTSTLTTTTVAAIIPTSVVETSISNCSLAINDEQTELHATWSAKRAAQTSTFNICYSKAIINSNDSVTWGETEVVTTLNSGTYPNAFINPTITLQNKIAIITTENSGYLLRVGNGAVANHGLTIFKRDITLTTHASISGNWTFNTVYTPLNATYPQSSPSMVFVPSKINGLDEGRIWVAWQGKDTPDTVAFNIRVSYSDDGGLTWSTMEKLTSGNIINQTSPSLSYNANNELFIVYSGGAVSALDYRVMSMKYSNGWQAPAQINGVKGNYASAMEYLDYSLPLFIYTDETKGRVGFYGTWMVIENPIDGAIIVEEKLTLGASSGRKLVRLTNGWLVAVMHDEVQKTIRLFKSMDDGESWEQLCTLSNPSPSSEPKNPSLSNKGNVVYVLYNTTNALGEGFVRFLTLDVLEATDKNYYNSAVDTVIDPIEQNNFLSTSIARNETATQLYAVWTSKDEERPNSYNIHYVTGSTSEDGHVAWGSVELVTADNSSSSHYKNASVTVKDGVPFIVCETVFGTNNYVAMFTKAFVSPKEVSGSSSWGSKILHDGDTYSQSSASGVFVSKSKNGLTNGLIGFMWHGYDATDQTTRYIRFSRSVDSGITWSPVQKLVPGMNGTLTANRNGTLFIVYEDGVMVKRIQSSDNGGTWSAPVTIGAGTNPSSLLDFTINTSEPLTIIKGPLGIVFIGAWTAVIVSISPEPGFIGKISNYTSVLSYAITSDSSMSTIVEKINGAVISSKTAASGQYVIAALTPEQWNVVRHGKYMNSDGELNTLTVEMDSDVFTYTFDKRLPQNPDSASTTKAILDSQEVFVPAMKKEIASAISAQGVATSQSDTMSTLATKINQIDQGVNGEEGAGVLVKDTLYRGDPVFLKNQMDLVGSLANPVALPVNTSYCSAYSPSGTHMAIGHASTPYVTIYERNGDVFNKLANPTLPPSNVNGIAFSPDSMYMHLAHVTSPFISIYKRNGDVFTKLANPAVLPSGVGNAAAVSPDGNYMAVAHTTTPFVSIYKKYGDVFTKLANPSSLPTGNGLGVVFSPDGNYMSVSHDVTPFVTIYKKDGDTFTKLADPSILPPSKGNGIAFSPDGALMSVVHPLTPFVTTYKREGDVFTKMYDPRILPKGEGKGVAFSTDGTYMSVSHDILPFLTLYKRDGDVFVKTTNPNILPTSVGNGVSFSPDGVHLTVACSVSPFMANYKFTKKRLAPDKKLVDPNVLPLSAANATAFSPDGVYMSVVDNDFAELLIYKKSGDTFTKLVGTVTLPGKGNGVSFSPDGNYLGVVYQGVPHFTLYKRDGDIFTALASAGIALPNMGNGISFSPDNTYIGIAHNTTPFVSIYKRNGDTLTKLANPGVLPPGDSFGVAFSPDSIYMSVAHVTTPFLTIYKRSGDTFTKLANPSTMPAGSAYNVAFSPDNIYMSVAHAISPYVTVYKRTLDVFARLETPDIAPVSSGRYIEFSSDNNFMSVAHAFEPGVATYRRNGDFFTKMPDPSDLVVDSGNGLAFSPDSKYLSLAHDGFPYVTTYKLPLDLIATSTMIRSGLESYGYMKEDSLAGEIKQVAALPFPIK